MPGMFQDFFGDHLALVVTVPSYGNGPSHGSKAKGLEEDH